MIARLIVTGKPGTLSRQIRDAIPVLTERPGWDGRARVCPQCDGRGSYHMEKDFGEGRVVEWSRPCPDCRGTGRLT